MVGGAVTEASTATSILYERTEFPASGALHVDDGPVVRGTFPASGPVPAGVLPHTSALALLYSSRLCF